MLVSFSQNLDANVCLKIWQENLGIITGSLFSFLVVANLTLHFSIFSLYFKGFHIFLHKKVTTPSITCIIESTTKQSSVLRKVGVLFYPSHFLLFYLPFMVTSELLFASKGYCQVCMYEFSVNKPIIKFLL